MIGIVAAKYLLWAGGLTRTACLETEMIRIGRLSCEYFCNRSKIVMKKPKVIIQMTYSHHVLQIVLCYSSKCSKWRIGRVKSSKKTITLWLR